MTLYKFEVLLGDIFIRYVEVSANRIGEANRKAKAELVRLYPNTYKKLNTSLYKTNDRKLQAQTKENATVALI